MIRVLMIVAAVIALAACKPGRSSEQSSADVPVVTQPAQPPPIHSLTPTGWGAIQVGMREPDALKAAPDLMTTPPPHDEDWLACHELTVRGQPGLFVMVEEEELTRLTINSPSTLKTDKGVGIGAPEAEVKAAYGPELEVTPHKYESAPAHYLTAFDAKTQRGVRYETSDKGVVTAIHVGMGSIELIEGCS